MHTSPSQSLWRLGLSLSPLRAERGFECEAHFEPDSSKQYSDALPYHRYGNTLLTLMPCHNAAAIAAEHRGAIGCSHERAFCFRSALFARFPPAAALARAATPQAKAAAISWLELAPLDGDRGGDGGLVPLSLRVSLKRAAATRSFREADSPASSRRRRTAPSSRSRARNRISAPASRHRCRPSRHSPFPRPSPRRPRAPA